MQVPIYLDNELAEKINVRLPRNIKIAVLGRWMLRAIVLTQKELEQTCWENEAEAYEVGPFLQDALRKLFEAQKAVEKKAAAK